MTDPTTITDADAIAQLKDEAEKIAAGTARYNDFVVSLSSTLRRKGKLSDKQMAAFKRGMAKQQDREAERAAENANAEQAPVGTVVVRGEIVSVKVKDGNYGMQFKMTVKDERGFRVWGTLPRKVEDAALALHGDELAAKGMQIQFTAEVEPSDNDPFFAFIKRPRDVEILEAGDGAITGGEITERNVADDPKPEAPSREALIAEIVRLTTRFSEIEAAIKASTDEQERDRLDSERGTVTKLMTEANLQLIAA